MGVSYHVYAGPYLRVSTVGMTEGRKRILGSFAYEGMGEALFNPNFNKKGERARDEIRFLPNRESEVQHDFCPREQEYDRDIDGKKIDVDVALFMATYEKEIQLFRDAFGKEVESAVVTWGIFVHYM